MSEIERRLGELGLDIQPFPTQEGAMFAPAVRVGDWVFTSGQAPEQDGDYLVGKVGDTVDLDTAVEAARRCAVNTLRAIVSIGVPLDRVDQVVKLNGMVNAVPDFAELPAVIDGASRVMCDVFGQDGVHARTAVGMVLPFGIAVELDTVVHLR